MKEKIIKALKLLMYGVPLVLMCAIGLSIVGFGGFLLYGLFCVLWAEIEFILLFVGIVCIIASIRCHEEILSWSINGIKSIFKNK